MVPDLKKRLPDWEKIKADLDADDAVRMIRVHEGFFLTMGVENWQRFEQTMFMLHDNPALVHRIMDIQAEFNASLIDQILSETTVDAAVFSEPIGGNNGPLLSPQTYQEFVLRSYEPVKEVLLKHNVKTFILRTYANTRVLIPSLLEWGFTCLWACEVRVKMNRKAIESNTKAERWGNSLLTRSRPI